jgi:hypothetical protein
MEIASPSRWIERAADAIGAAAMAAGSGVSAAYGAARVGYPVAASAIGMGAVGALIGWLAMRAVPASAPVMPLPDFVPAEIEVDPFEPQQDEASGYDRAPDPLLLDDALDEPDPGSRVVALFAAGRPPTAGELQDRIDRHLRAERPAVAPQPQRDDADALHAALEEIRRSLRRG